MICKQTLSSQKCNSPANKIFCLNDLAGFIFSSVCSCLANCFRSLGLGGSQWRHGLLYSNASLLFLHETGFSIAPRMAKQKRSLRKQRLDLIASVFVKTRFTNVHHLPLCLSSLFFILLLRIEIFIYHSKIF